MLQKYECRRFLDCDRPVVLKLMSGSYGGAKYSSAGIMMEMNYCRICYMNIHSFDTEDVCILKKHRLKNIYVIITI